jgi:malate dehydrogenase (oxaloacetate-decarboxylating)
MNFDKMSLDLHQKHKGKLEIKSIFPLNNLDDLSVAYTPGVAEPCRVIASDPSKVNELTIKNRSVAVITDGSSVLGLGNIGPEAALPVMEGKAILFKHFANIDAYPICLDTQDVEEIILTIKNISPGFGGINLEDISAPRCFEIEERLIEELDIPVMHDDQHGTAIVVLAGLINALKVVDKKLDKISVVISGAGAAGLGVSNLLLNAGVKKIKILDSRGTLTTSRSDLNKYKKDTAILINSKKPSVKLIDAIKNSDVFIGVSKPSILTKEMVLSMNVDPVIFALSNPVPEIDPQVAKEAGAAVVATGRSDLPNQINNALVFPGVFKGVMGSKHKKITSDVRLSAAFNLAAMVKNPNSNMIIPSLLNNAVVETVARAVAID